MLEVVNVRFELEGALVFSGDLAPAAAGLGPLLEELSTTVLSQCTNQAIFRCTNPYDLEHIGKSSEGLD